MPNDLMTRRSTAGRADTFDEGKRTVEVIWSTGVRVKRYSYDEGYYMEELSMDPKHIRLDRLNKGASLLDSHDSWSMNDRLGAVVKGTAKVANGEGTATVQLSRKPQADELLQDLRDGLPMLISVGYKVYKSEKIEGDENTLPVHRAIDWEPYELSAVPIPADPDARTRTLLESDMPVPANRRSAVTPPATDPTDDIETEVRIFNAADKKRYCEQYELGQDFYEAHKRKPEAAYKSAVLDALAERQTPIFTVSGVDNTDPAVTRQHRIEAYAARLGGPAPCEAARAYASDRLIDHAAWEIERGGGRAKAMAPDEIFGRSGAHTTSDFPLFLQGVGDRLLTAAYALAQSPFKSVLATETRLPDFRPRMRLKLSDIGKLEKLNESGEITATTRSESYESTALDTFARGFILSRKAKINDDLGAFADWNKAAGRAAAETENALLFAMLTQSSGAGPTMNEDGKALFHANHGNLASSGTVLDETNVSAARLAMRKIKGLDGKTPVNVAPKYLVVGPELETAAEKLLATIYAASAAEANPFTGRLSLLVEGLITDRSWFVFADPTAFPVLEYAHLESAPGPQVATRENFWTADTEFRVMLDFGAAATDWRGAYRNPGTSPG